MSVFLSSLLGSTHAVVKFVDDHSISTVPLKILDYQCSQICHQIMKLSGTDRKKYSADFLAIGM